MRDLRPLGAGELLDRAVTLFVQRFVAVVAVLGAAYVPYGIVQWLVLGPVLRHLEAFTRLPRGPQAPASLDAMLGSGGASRFAVTMLLALVLYALVRSALVALLDAAYAGERRSLRDAYATALRRALPQLLLACTAGLLALALWIAIVIAASLGAIVLGLLFARLGPAVMGAVVAAVLLLTGALPLAWTYVAYQLATVEVARGRAAFAALGYGLACALGSLRWRALLAALVLAAVTLGGQIAIVLLGVMLAQIAPVPGFEFAAGTVLGILLEGLVSSFVVVFAVDVKVRREGLDLALAAGPESALPA